jgi:hypothetical protein
MPETSQLMKYLTKAGQSKSLYQSSESAERLAEVKKLRSDLARHGGHIVLPLLEATESYTKGRVLLSSHATIQALPTMGPVLIERAIRLGFESTTELVREVGHDAEKALILALDHPSSYVRLLAVTLLGQESVRSRASVQPLKSVLDKGNELGLIEVVAVASLLMNRDTDRGTREELSRFLAHWINNDAPALEADGEKQPERSPDTFPARVHGLVPRMLFLLAASEQQ